MCVCICVCTHKTVENTYCTYDIYINQLIYTLYNYGPIRCCFVLLISYLSSYEHFLRQSASFPSLVPNR